MTLLAEQWLSFCQWCWCSWCVLFWQIDLWAVAPKASPDHATEPRYGASDPTLEQVSDPTQVRLEGEPPFGVDGTKRVLVDLADELPGNVGVAQLEMAAQV